MPATLVTSDPAAARAFQAEYGEVIYKSASGIRSIVRRLGPDQLARLAFLRDGPAQFQAFVPGRNVRVHTVGDAVFATRIETEAVDYRYAHLDGLDVAMTPVTLPAAVEAACLRARPRSRPPLRRDRPQGDPGRGVRLLRGQPLPGLHLLRAPHRPADQHGARRPTQRHGSGRPARARQRHKLQPTQPGGKRLWPTRTHDETAKEPFVSQADRPEVRLKSDTPLTELRVRDLATLLGQLGGTRKDFWDGKDWEKDDFDGPVIKWKDDKEFKDKEKEKDRRSKEKREGKLEKREVKEVKAEKIELDGVFEPGILPGPDPRLDQVIQALSGLTSASRPARRPGRGAEEGPRGLIHSRFEVQTVHHP